MTDIFISYSRKDLAVASTLAQTLEDLGYSVWWDMSGLYGGQSFAKVIQEKLSDAKCAIVVWSPDSVKSNWVHSEASFADNRGILLTAVYREAQAPMPFNNRHNESLRDWNGSIFDENFQKLLKAIDRLCPNPSGKPRNTEITDEQVPSNPETPTQKPEKPVSPDSTVSNERNVVEAATPATKTEPNDTDSSHEGSTSSGLSRKILAAAVAIAIGTAGYVLYPKRPQPSTTQNIQLLPDQTITDSVSSPEPVTTQADAPILQTSTPVVALSGAPDTEPQQEIQTKVDDVAKQQASTVTSSLLEQAKEALDKNRLTIPEDKSVLYFAGNVLREDPKNTEALTLLTDAATRYQQWASSNMAKQQFDKAKGYLDSSEKLIEAFSLSQMEPNQKELRLAVERALTRQAEEKAAINKTYQLPNDLTLRPIPAGSFRMGSNEYPSEKPVRKVTFAKPFWMSKTEVTFDQYDAYAVAAGKEKPNDRGWGRANRPAINVSWNDAQGYVKWLSQNNNQGLQCRLPSEAEWEYAARAGTTTQYFWGDQVGKNNANCDGCDRRWGNQKTAPVASYSANKWGLNDMHGNVWEWVQDPWHKDYQGAPNNGEVWEKDGDARRVLRGGSWSYAPFFLRSASRIRFTPVYRSRLIGFRVVCSPH